MMGPANLLVGLSALALFIAALLAARLGGSSRQLAGWSLVALAVFLMGVQRSVALHRHLTDTTVSIDLLAEATALTISLLLVLGLARVAPQVLAARRSTERATALGRILDESHNEIYLFDGETLRFLEVSRGARENLGFSMDELSKLTPLDIKPELTPERFAELLAPLRSGDSEQIRFTTLHRRKDGSRYPIEVSLQLGEVGDRPTFSAVILDVTERRRLEAATEQAGEGIVILDHRGVIEYANLALARMLQRPRETMVGGGIDALAFGGSDEALLTDMRQKLLAGEPWTGRYESVWPDGKLRTHDTTVGPVRSPEGDVQGFIGVIRDVTREAALEEELRQAQKMEAVGQLAGGVAHDFNNLLTVIGGWVSALTDDDPGNARDAIREIGLATERAAALTRQLLTFSRRDRPEPQPIELNARVAEIQKLLGRLLGDDVVLEVRLGPDVGCVHADPSQVEQVILNLALNARDAMPRGGRLGLQTDRVTFGAETERRPGNLPPGRYARLRVTDVGKGMPPEVRERIFEPFFTTKALGEGTGLGLSTVYAIVAAAGGAIDVESEPGRGSRFNVYLPWVEAEPAHVQSASRLEPAPAPQASILLVEDEPSVRDLARRILESAGHRVHEAADGREALAVTEPFDLLLTDMVMPNVSGAEVVRRLRERFPELAVIMTSGYLDHGSDHGGGGQEAAGADAFLAKPFRRDDLLRAVSEVLAASAERAEREAATAPPRV